MTRVFAVFDGEEDGGRRDFYGVIDVIYGGFFIVPDRAVEAISRDRRS